MLTKSRQKPDIYRSIKRSFAAQWLALLLLALFLASNLAWATTPSGTVIKNQASATYLDANGVEQFVTSNIVETTVQPVAGVTLVQDSTHYVSTNGGTVNIPHVLTNSGNSNDSYDLTLTNLAGSGFDFSTIEIYADADRNGLADSNTPLDLSGASDTPLLAPGESWYFIVSSTVPAGETAADSDQYQITATSTCSCNAAPGEALSDSNTNTVIVTDQAIIELSKSVSASSGSSPSSPTSYTYTLSYTNTGDSDGTNVLLSDAIPAGLTYVANSARWSHSGVTVLTDSNPDDLQGPGGTEPTIRYCAAQGSTWVADCQDTSTPLMPVAQAPGNVTNPDNSTYSSTWQVGAVIDTIAAGETATLSFEFTVDTGLSAQTLYNVAEVLYNADGAGVGAAGNEHFYSNVVDFNILAEAGVVANSNPNSSTAGADDSLDASNISSLSAVPGGIITFTGNHIWNTGNGVDTFDIEISRDASGNLLDREGNVLTNGYPAGTGFTLLKSDGHTPLVDTNGNGIPDTGPVEPGTFYAVSLRVTLPYNIIPGNNGGNGWEVTKRATSTLDPGISNATTDRTGSIFPITVDLSNAATLNAQCTGTIDGGLGSGAGPEATPVTTLDMAPGGSCSFQLLVNSSNQLTPPMQAPDNYNLVAGSWDGSNFTANDLPDGWTITFYEDGGAGDCSTLGDVINNTGPLLPGVQKLVCAQVTVPEDFVVADGSSTGTLYDIYFQASSPLTGASDIKHDAVNINIDASLQMGISIEPNQFGQTDPGSIIVYDHIVQNTGNVAMECLNVTGANDLAADGWSIAIFEDIDENAELTTPDTPLTGFSLAVGEKKFLLVKLYAPSSAAYGTVNTTTLTLTGYADNGDGDPAICNTDASNQATDTAVDETTVARTDIIITKQQALDAGCDGSIDGPGACTGDACFTASDFSAAPAQDCIIYKLTAENTGLETVQNVVIRDAAPNFTVFYNGGVLSLPTVSDGNTTGGTDGSYGMVEGGAVGGAAVELAPGGTLELRFGVRVE